METLEDALLQSYEKGTFLDTVYQDYLKTQNRDKKLSALLVEFHNEGKVDILSEFKRLTRQDSNIDFFLIRDVIKDTLPYIDASVSNVMDCVKYLTQEAGDEMTSHMLMTPFISFCKNNPERPEAVLKKATNEIDEGFDFITSAIISGSSLDFKKYTNKAIALVNDNNETVSIRAIFSLSRLDFGNQTDLIQSSIKVIVSKFKSTNDEIFLPASFKALISLSIQDPTSVPTVLSFIKDHQEDADDQLTHTAIEILFLENGKISEDLENGLLEFSYQVKEKNQGTIKRLDYVLLNLLKRDDLDKVTFILEGLLERPSNDVSIFVFKSFIHELYDNKETYLSKLITKWLLSKVSSLGRACLDLLESSRTEGIVIECDISQLSGENENAHLFLAKKACGWLFLRQISAISFISSLIEYAPEDQIEEISNIVLNPLLISYSGGVRQYLEEKLESAPKKLSKFIIRVLDLLDEYHNNLGQASEINELKPSKAQRHTYRQYHSKIMDQIQTKAREKSILFSIVKESMILYGDSSIHYIDNGKEKTRQETPMQTISTSFEFPMLQYIDPHGLDNQLLMLRLEGCIR